MANILVVDDDSHIREVVRFALEKADHHVCEAADGRAALAEFARAAADLVVLDVLMPEMDGLEVCRELRRTSRVPILFLSSRDEEVDRVVGLELGADDYVVKPFSPRELVARVGAILRRTGGAAQQDPAGEGAGKKTASPAHPIQLDWDCKSATYQGVALDLTRSEFKIMTALMRRPGVVFSRNELLDILYPHGESVVQKAVDVHIHNIRKKLGENGAALLQTVRSFGYRLAKHHDDAP